MPVCPSGHSSGADDYCDVCGTRMSGPSSASAPQQQAPAPGGGGGAGERCPDCSTPRTGRFCEDCGYDFAVGVHRAATTGPVQAPPPPPPPPPAASYGTPPAEHVRTPLDDAPTGKFRPRSESRPQAAPEPPAAWTAIVTADRDYYEMVVREADDDAPPFTFPPYRPELRIPLTTAQVRIGRRSVSQGTVPEIDLSEPPEDPGVSHTHAVLLAKPDGGWTLVDPGSTNGTTVNGGVDPISVNVEVPLKDGDRVHVGVWTTITLRRG